MSDPHRFREDCSQIAQDLVELAPGALCPRRQHARALKVEVSAERAGRTIHRQPGRLYYRWSKDFLEAGKKRLAGDTARAATSDEVKDLRREATAVKEVVADLTLENRLLEKSVTADGEDEA